MGNVNFVRIVINNYFLKMEDIKLTAIEWIRILSIII